MVSPTGFPSTSTVTPANTTVSFPSWSASAKKGGEEEPPPGEETDAMDNPLVDDPDEVPNRLQNPHAHCMKNKVTCVEC